MRKKPKPYFLLEILLCLSLLALLLPLYTQQLFKSRISSQEIQNDFFLSLDADELLSKVKQALLKDPVFLDELLKGQEILWEESIEQDFRGKQHYQCVITGKKKKNYMKVLLSISTKNNLMKTKELFFYVHLT